jgi:hypothetical protein
MYHAIMYGKNLMGAYSSQLDAKQRWMVLAYIKSEQAKNGGSPLGSSFSIAEAGAEIKATAVDAKHDTTKHDVTAAETKGASTHDAKGEKVAEAPKDVKNATTEVKAADAKAPTATKTNNH